MTNKNQAVIEQLNILLKNELVAINQYFLHAKILQDQGITKLAAITRAESIDEMKHADTIIDRILYLKGMPIVTDYKKIRVGTDVKSMLKADFDLEMEAIVDLKKAIMICQENADTVSKNIAETILTAEENHSNFLETQLELIEKLGIQNYLVTQI